MYSLQNMGYSICHIRYKFLKYILVVLFFYSAYPAYSKSFVDGFESGSIRSDWIRADHGGNPQTIATIATSHACKGTYSLKSTAKYPPDYRTQVMLSKQSNPFHELKHNKEYWIGVAIYLAGGWPQDGNLDEILFEAHHRPDRKLGEPAGNGKGGQAPLILWTKKGQWRVTARTNKQKLCSGKCQSQVLDKYIGPHKSDRWTEFVFNVKFTHTNSGFLKVWKDNQLVVNYSGPFGYNDEKGEWILLGLYKAIWKYGKSKVRTRTVYHDEFKIIEGAGSPSSVAPNCGKSNKLPPPTKLKIIN